MVILLNLGKSRLMVIFVDCFLDDCSLNEYILSWKYDIRRNVNSDISIVTMRRVAIMFFELGVVKNFMQKF